MALQFHTIEQNTAPWLALRAGKVTASGFKKVLAKGEGIVRKKYLMQLAGEILTEEAHEGYSNKNMDRGHEFEGRIRDRYSFEYGIELTQEVGFITNGRVGYSPDSMVVGKPGLVEVKSEQPDLLIATLFADKFPAEHKAQAQGGLWVAELEWIDVVIGWNEKLPLFVKRAYRDEKYILELKSEVNRFHDDLDKMVDRLKRWGEPVEAAA